MLESLTSVARLKKTFWVLFIYVFIYLFIYLSIYLFIYLVS